MPRSRSILSLRRRSSLAGNGHARPIRLLSRLFLAVLLLAIVGGVVFLMTWDIPPPSAPVEKVIPSDRFPR